ncbi:bifunctional metallophosphatase/5'-nucleotidase [Sphingomonas sp. LY160]|uniref:bifunctional metallophosphatase/5'-nucleotidase n=1 Tax=Sphingomonas sp. LY160 TaxID=3095342 RepID=UPI002ADECE7E|nr:bifunctional metallophosphatase/5'-nucleotidase [Sphingomonas sp. LY160]MEA1070938.1 bifunctional metallophosphatase/5'-nucleotidase [Sphingomonas sp. LY160]
MRNWSAFSLLLLAGCATVPRAPTPPAGPVDVQLIGINDFHGNLEPPKNSIDATLPDGTAVKVPAGGVAHIAAAAKALREGKQYSVTVSAGDMIGATPLVSALFLDEPAVSAMNLVGVEYNAVGNHEFDKGSAELLRMQSGGCEKHTTRTPCKVEPFTGARFKYLAANVVKADGSTLFPGTGIKDFGPVQIGFIGMTLKETGTLVTPAGVAGLTFADEAATANAAVPALKAAGADAIVLLIHQGGRTSGGYNDKNCPELSGDILPILDRLDPAIGVVVSGHTHNAYICRRARPSGGDPILLTSAGRYGTLITDMRLSIDPAKGLVASSADNVIVQGEGYTAGGTSVAVNSAFPVFPAEPETKALIDRYVAAAKPEAARVVGRLSGPVLKKEDDNREQTAGNFIADAQLAASRDEGAEVAFINSGGVRTDLVPAPDGSVTFGNIFAMQPFGNSLVVKTLTGVQLKALLEQQFDSGSNTAERPNLLLPSKGFFFSYDLSRPTGQRIVTMALNGKSIDPAATYRVTVNNFMASGGDNFTVLAQGTDATDAGSDVEALEAYLKVGATVPALGRVRDVTPR